VNYETAYREYRAAWMYLGSVMRMRGRDDPEYREALEIFRLATNTMRLALGKR
jgi:hypothetical protein